MHDLGATGGLLFVRSIDDVSHALQAVSELLSWRRVPNSTDGQVLGVLVSEDVDWGLPVPTSRVPRLAHTDAALRESVAMAGIWSLCWFDFLAVGDYTLAADLRRRLLDTLLRARQADRNDAMGRRRVFFPVLTPVEAHQEVALVLADIQTRYPSLEVSRDCFVGDPARVRFVSVASASW